MIWIFLLIGVGVFLSAFFSGSETGFYRVSRVRLVLDGLDGDSVSRRLLWLTNNPTLFVATTLVGNNVANYLTSLGVVLFAQRMFVGHSVDLLAPILVAPILFIYGESLPKQLFLSAPNMLLRRVGSLFVVFAFVFAPLTIVLWAMGRALQKTFGKAPETVRLTIARSELEHLLSEGHDMGILKPAQHELAQTLFNNASQPVRRYATPTNRLVSIDQNSSREEGLKISRQKRLSTLIVRDEAGNYLGYVRAIDLYLGKGKSVSHFSPPLKVSAGEMLLDVLIKMQTERVPVAFVFNNEEDAPIGVVFEYQLSQAMGISFGAAENKSS